LNYPIWKNLWKHRHSEERRIMKWYLEIKVIFTFVTEKIRNRFQPLSRSLLSLLTVLLLSGNGPLINVVEAQSEEPDNKQVIELEHEAEPDDLPEPGGEVTFEVELKNEGDTALTITSLKDSLFMEQALDLLPLELPAGEEWKHTYKGTVEGVAGDVIESALMVAATDSNGNELIAASTTKIKIEKEDSDDDSELEFEYEVSPDDLPEPGGEVTFEVKIKNEGQTPLVLSALIDSILLDQAVDILPVEISSGEEWRHEFLGAVEGVAGEVLEHVLTATLLDSDQNELQFEAKTKIRIESDDKFEPDPDEKPADLAGVVIGDKVWLDVDQDGVQSEGEPGIKGVLIQLFRHGKGDLLDETLSAEDGTYRFEGDYPSKVYLGVIVPEGFALTLRNAGEDRSVDSDLDPLSARSKKIKLKESEGKEGIYQHDTEWDIGLIEADNQIEMVGVVDGGFWKNHTETWPVDKVVVGNIEYTKEQALARMTGGADKSFTLFRELVTALLNIESGVPEDCIVEEIEVADQWLATNPPGSNVKANTDAWKGEGKGLHSILKSFNQGKLCAETRPASRTPVSVAFGFRNEGNGKGKGFKIRTTAEAGRIVLLQKSFDMETWEDVKILKLDYGVLEFHEQDIDQDPNAFYRLVFQEGAAGFDETPAQRGAFLQLESNQTENLDPWVYEGDLEIKGNGNVVKGSIDEKGFGTVVAGDLIIRGNTNEISGLTVMGNIIIRGNGNVLNEVDYEGDIVETGNGNEY
jgi:hypothetical protein